MDRNTIVSEAINKISTERAAMLDTFVAAILKVRQDIGENIDMNYIALEYSNDLDEHGIFRNRVKVIYIRKD